MLTKKLQLDVWLVDWCQIFDSLADWPISWSVSPVLALSVTQWALRDPERSVAWQRGPELGWSYAGQSLSPGCSCFCLTETRDLREGFLHRITIRWNLNSSSRLLLQLAMFIVRTPPDWEHMFSTPFSGVCKQFIAGKGAACLHSVPTVPINLPHPSPLQSKELLSCHYKLYTSHIYDKKQLNTKYWGNLFWQVLIWHSSPTDQISS